MKADLADFILEDAQSSGPFSQSVYTPIRVSTNNEHCRLISETQTYDGACQASLAARAERTTSGRHLLKCLGGHKIRDRMHDELPETAFDVRGPENAEDRLQKYKGLEEVGGSWISKECCEVQ